MYSGDESREICLPPKLIRQNMKRSLDSLNLEYVKILVLIKIR